MAKQVLKLPIIHPDIIYRVAQFEMQAELKGCWPQLKESIRLSSPDFYEEIQSLETMELNSLPGKKKETIQKYFNRARYRATPYGSFAGVGIFLNSGNKGENKITIGQDQEIHRFTDWPLKSKVAISVKDLLSINAIIIANSSRYTIGENIRYIFRNENGFELSDVVQHPLIMEVLNACKEPIGILSLKALLVESCPSDGDFEHLIAGLLGLQLIFTSLQPNIIGEDYFTRIGFKPHDEKGYIIAHRSCIEGNIDQKLFSHLPELCALFQQLPEKKEENGLQRFIRRFQKRYDRRAVPLMEALDPEMGIGYDDMEQDFNAQGIVGDFVPSKSPETDSPLKLFITGNLPLQGKAEDTIIRLEHFKIPDKANIKPVPNSISALVEITNDLVQLVSFSGSTANALAGRFTLVDDTILEHCQSVARQEQAANPDALFFDIAYIGEDKVDNVNRRRSIYDYQLAIGNFDTSDDPIQLSDLLLFVHNNKLILWSSKHQKRMIPRLATAYNYTRSDLPLFRLLCDLQHQGLTNQFTLQLRSLMPNFSFYPRVQFHNVIVSPAAWKLAWKEFKASGLDIIAYLDSLGASPFIRTGTGDQTLCFSSNDVDELKLLEALLEKEKSLYVEETIIPNGDIVRDVCGKQYAAQFLLTLQHQDTIYQNIAPVLQTARTPALYVPGSEWLYIELYAHPRQFEKLLVNSIAEWLKEHRHLTYQWFFIRFNEGGDHIRLRVKMKDSASMHILLNSLTTVLKDEVRTGIVSDMQLKTYRPEWERYGPDMMELVETHFCTDSRYVLELVSLQLADNAKYKLCTHLLQVVSTSGIFGFDTFDTWLKDTTQRWEQEHQVKVPGFKKLNQHYKVFQATPTLGLSEAVSTLQNKFVRSLVSLLQRADPAARLDLLSSLLHMHINRLFNYHQRTHELIVYYFFSKETASAKAAIKTPLVQAL